MPHIHALPKYVPLLRGDKGIVIDADLERAVYRYNAAPLRAVAGIVLLTNLFWLVISAVRHAAGAEASPFSYYFILSLLIAASAAVFVLSLNRKLRDNGICQRFTLLIYLLLISSEVAVLAVTKNVQALKAGTRIEGVALSSIYLFAFIFVPLVRVTDCALVSLAILAPLVIPIFAPGSGAYNAVPSILMGACLVPAALIYRRLLLSMLSNARSLEGAQERYRNLTRQSMETIAGTIDAKDDYLNGHSKRVAVLSLELARRLDMSEAQQEELYFAGLLHDIGKIATPANILNKESRLDEDEFTRIKRHPADGCTILRNMTDIPALAEAVRAHHEHYDGSGYPDGIAGEAIPLYARIVCVADSYDAMCGERPYRKKGLTKEESRAELLRCSGTHFDPKVVEAMVAYLDEQQAN